MEKKPHKEEENIYKYTYKSFYTPNRKGIF